MARLDALVAQARSRLAVLNQEVADAEGRLGDMQSVRLLEANENLVLAAMRAQTDADTASHALAEVALTARLDALTGLPNRMVLLDRLAHALPSAKRRGVQLALLFLDLNNFKQINDALGHGVGDRVLKQVADRLSGAIREGDTVSRLGGDEFVFLLAEVAHVSDAALVADKLISALAEPMGLDDDVLRLTASIGISLYPGDGDEVSVLLDRADRAMYRAKRDGLRSVAFYDERLEADRHLNPRGLVSMSAPFTRAGSAFAEHERLNEVLREANEQLVLVALGAKDLEAAAQQAHARQNQQLARVAHELRNPLVPIRIAVAAMAKAPDKVLPRIHALLERQVAHLTRLVDDLVDESRVRTGKLRIHRERLDVVDVIDAAIDVGRPAMDMRLQSLVVQMPSCAMKIDADPVRLAQVFNNLLDNASKYTPKGGRIRLSVDVHGGLVTVIVTDSGIGISAETLGHVFEPFVQDAHAIGFNGAGLGIGLTVVLELVEAHGGTVVARSAGVGHGSEFVVTLPLSSS